MIIHSVTYAMEENLEQDWLSFMKSTFLPAMMDTGYFEGYQFTRVIPEVGTDTAYNVQFKCFNLEKLNLFFEKVQEEINSLMINRYKGKFASFATKLEEVL